LPLGYELPDIVKEAESPLLEEEEKEKGFAPWIGKKARHIDKCIRISTCSTEELPYAIINNLAPSST